MKRAELLDRCEAILSSAMDSPAGVHVFFTKNGAFVTRQHDDPGLNRAITRAGRRYMGRYDIACDARWLLADMRDQVRSAS